MRSSDATAGTASLFFPSTSELGGASLSSCGRYRYHLWRAVGPEPTRVVFVMLNPSTADAMTDDPTIRKCVGFSRRWGYGYLDVVNLFAWRATNPKMLATVEDPIGPENGLYQFSVMRCASLVVCAWGSDKFARQQAVAFRRHLSGIDAPVKALRISDGGAPWHPLYVPYDVTLQPYPSRGGEER